MNPIRILTIHKLFAQSLAYIQGYVGLGAKIRDCKLIALISASNIAILGSFVVKIVEIWNIRLTSMPEQIPK